MDTISSALFESKVFIIIFFLSFVKNYHFADINLFWADIQKNAVERSEAWFQENTQ